VQSRGTVAAGLRDKFRRVWRLLRELWCPRPQRHFLPHLVLPDQGLPLWPFARSWRFEKVQPQRCAAASVGFAAMAAGATGAAGKVSFNTPERISS